MTHLLTVGTSWARGANGASQTLGRDGQVRGRERQPGTRCPAGSLGRPHPGALGVSFHGPQNALSPRGPSVDREVPADAQPTRLNTGAGTTLTHSPSVPCMHGTPASVPIPAPREPATSTHLLVHRPSQARPRGLSHQRHPVEYRKRATSGRHSKTPFASSVSSLNGGPGGVRARPRGVCCGLRVGDEQ